MTTPAGCVEVIVHQTTKAGRLECGDSYFFIQTDSYFACVIADGLGSGKYAREASQAVVDVVREHHHEDVDTLMRRSNAALVQKRGAAVAVFKIYPETREFYYSCVGNIRFFLYSTDGKLTYPLPVTGYLSGRPVTLQTKRYSYESNSKFLVHSDGINPNGIKQLLANSTSIECIAQRLKEKFSSNTDDSTFIVGWLS